MEHRAFLAPTDTWVEFSIISGVAELLNRSEDVVLLDGTAARLLMDKADEPYDSDNDDVRVVGLRPGAAERGGRRIGQALGRDWYRIDG